MTKSLDKKLPEHPDIDHINSCKFDRDELQILRDKDIPKTSAQIELWGSTAPD